jgi:hypothetical protein
MVKLSSRIALQRPCVEKDGDSFSLVSSAAWRSLILPGLLALLISPNASGDIYQWTDEQGGTVISNVLPDSPKQAKNIERVVKETPPAARAARTVTATEQALLDRIESLERRLQARQYPPPAPADYAADRGYYPPPPPPPSGYYGNYAPTYYPSYHYPLVMAAPMYPYVVYPRTIVARPAAVGAHRGSFHGGAGHRARR